MHVAVVPGALIRQRIGCVVCILASSLVSTMLVQVISICVGRALFQGFAVCVHVFTIKVSVQNGYVLGAKSATEKACNYAVISQFVFMCVQT